MAETVGQLVGRTDELALIDSALGVAEAGRAMVLQVAGDPGIGKTRLLMELAGRAEVRRHLVLAGRASELERDLPYWIFVDALDEYLRTVGSSWIEELDRSSEGELSRIFPALTGSSAVPATVLDERYRVHRAVRTLLEQLAEPRPLVLLLDDLHWADPASVDLVGSLLRRPPNARVVVAIALRARQAPLRLGAALQDAQRTGGLIHIEPRPLDEAEVEELLGPDVSPAVARQLHEESGGNPFYLDQLVRATDPASGLAVQEAGSTQLGGEELPSAVAVALASELADLSIEARSFLEAAAVVGDPFELDFTTATAELEEAEALVALDGLLEAGLVHRTDVPRRFRFRHPILRRAVYDAAGSAWKHAAHGRAARVLAAHGEPPASCAHHVDQVAALGDRDAIRLFRDAADASAERAPASAARWYRAALRLLPHDADDEEERAALLGQLAGALAGIGQFEESRAALLELLALTPAEAPALRVRVTAACAGLEHLLGRHDEAHARLVGALDQLQEQDSAEGAALMLDLAMDAYYTPDYERMHEWGLRAVVVAERLADKPLIAAAHAVVCLGDAYGGRIVSAVRHHATAQELVDGMDDDALALRLDAVANLGGAEIYLGRNEDAVRHARRGLALGRATGRGQLYPLLTQELAVALGLLGRVDEARDHLGGAVEAARLVGSSQSLSWTLVNSAWTTMLSGELGAALELAEESVELVRGLDDSPITTWSASVLGAVLIEVGQPARGVEVIRANAGGPELSDIPGYFRVAVQERVTVALLTLGRHEEADRAASHAEEWAEATGLVLSRAFAARARAAVLLAAGDSRASATRALEAAAAADEIDARIDAARCRTLAGRALIAAGDHARAVDELAAAAGELDDCGAMRYRDEAERELRRLGRRDHGGAERDMRSARASMRSPRESWRSRGSSSTG